MNEIIESIKLNNENNSNLGSMPLELFSLYLIKSLEVEKKNILVVLPTLYEASKLEESLSSYTSNVLLFPSDNYLTINSLASSPELKIKRLETINSIISSNENNIIVTNLDAYLKKISSKTDYTNNIISINLGDKVSREELEEKLYKIGYERDSFVNKTGDIAIRGFVIDIYPLNEEEPVRIEFFGDEVSSIRTFDVDTQIKNKEIKNITILPINEKLSSSKTISDYLGNHLSFFKNKAGLESYLKKIKNSGLDLDNDLVLDKEIKEETKIYFDELDDATAYNLKYNLVPKFYENVESLEAFIESSFLKKQKVVIAINKDKFSSLKKYLKYKTFDTNENNLKDNVVNLIDKPIKEGFIYNNYVFISENELYKNRRVSKFKSKFKYGKKIDKITSLKVGDYVIHERYGIGIYSGLKTLNSFGKLKDYIEVKYKDNDKLYIPVNKIEYLNKYSSKEGTIPKINSLDNSSSWRSTKAKLRKRLESIAKDLMLLYAKREKSKGYAFSPFDKLEQEFASNFPYEETRDQLNAIRDVLSDMEKESPMDRLICGDVGYGKTEVAFRAMFKSVKDLKQVLYLCPTTILSKQQYESAKDRFNGFGFNISLLNRYTSPKEKEELINDLNSGKIDILFGTHALLNDKLSPKDLGLLIIDEEQRFGVKQKEKIKSFKENIDILTLSATPIPRTLQMSLSGLRSISVIETAPKDRYPIETYVIKENNALIKDAIYKELSRKGQVFILYNNILHQEELMEKLAILVPGASIINIHGRMNKDLIEDRMTAFINNEYDILLTTTIIENGIDIPNANTLIIYDADKYGLSQLYQIRGRVGRSSKIAYAYLMYEGGKVITDTARKRLEAIKNFTKLGSGYQISVRDLEIRGAGDILGKEQSGFIDTVGIELFTKMLNEEVLKLKGPNYTPEENEEEISKIDIKTETANHISDSYVDEDDLKIYIHQKINEIKTRDDLNSIKEELEDRFGKLSKDILIYMEEELFNALSINNPIFDKLEEDKNTYLIKFYLDKINVNDLLSKTININNNFKFKTSPNKLIIYINKNELDNNIYYYLNKLIS